MNKYRIIEVKTIQGDSVNVEYIIYVKFLFFFWRKLKLPTVIREDAFPRDRVYNYKKIAFTFPSLNRAKEYLFSYMKKENQYYKGFYLKKIFNYNYTYYTQVYERVSVVSKLKRVVINYDEAFFVRKIGNSDIRYVYETLQEAKDYIDSQETVIVKTVVFP